MRSGAAALRASARRKPLAVEPDELPAKGLKAERHERPAANPYLLVLDAADKRFAVIEIYTRQATLSWQQSEGSVKIRDEAEAAAALKLLTAALKP